MQAITLCCCLQQRLQREESVRAWCFLFWGRSPSKEDGACQSPGWPRAMSCHVMASRAMPGHISACHAIFLRVMPCHEYSMPCRVRIFWEKYLWKNIFRNLVPEFSWVQNIFRILVKNKCPSSAKSICYFSVCH